MKQNVLQNTALWALCNTPGHVWFTTVAVNLDIQN